MIDYRVVYNYFAGGTFWETLPIGINDVERIEVVRGPASALYGPNAAAGVINIITNHGKKEGVQSTAHISGGIRDIKQANIAVQYNSGNKTSFGLSGNYLYRGRSEDQYFDWKSEQYLPRRELNSLMLLGFDEPGKALKLYESDLKPEYKEDTGLDKYGVNAFLDYQISPQARIIATTGAQQSTAQKSYYNNFATPLSMYDSKSTYLDLRANIKHFFGQVSYLAGSHSTNYFWLNYEFDTIDTIFEYDWQFDKFNIRPGISHRHARYGGPLLSNRFFLYRGEKKEITTTAFSLLLDYRPKPRWRFISGLRIDKYNINDNPSITSELATTFRFDKNNLGRVVLSKANRAPFMLDTFIGEGVAVPVWLEPEEMIGEVRFLPNRDIRYLTNYTIEMGWRSQLTSDLNMDLEIFTSHLNDFIETDVTGLDFDYDSHYKYHGYEKPVLVQYITHDNNEAYKGVQVGMGFQIEYQWSDKLQTKFYGMVQDTWRKYDKQELKTRIRENFVYMDLDPTPEVVDSLANWQINIAPEPTIPDFYGGFMMNYALSDKINLNVTGYLMSRQYFQGVGVNQFYSETLKAFIDLNSRISYKVRDNMSVYFTARNMLGKHREYGFTDTIYPVYLVGMRYHP
jgi:iron complex outermembrane receptor protein